MFKLPGINPFANSDFSRLLRLALGVFVVVQGIVTNDWIFALIGALLAVMPLLNIGCCGLPGYCATSRSSNNETEDISYEEVR